MELDETNCVIKAPEVRILATLSKWLYKKLNRFSYFFQKEPAFFACHIYKFLKICINHQHDNDDEDVPIIEVRNGSNKKRFFNCKVCQRKFLKPEVARMHVEVVHMKLYQVRTKKNWI